MQKIKIARPTLEDICRKAFYGRIHLLPGLMDLVDGHRFRGAVDEDQRIAD